MSGYGCVGGSGWGVLPFQQGEVRVKHNMDRELRAGMVRWMGSHCIDYTAIHLGMDSNILLHMDLEE